MSDEELSALSKLRNIDRSDILAKIKSNHEACLNLFTGILTAILIMMIGAVIREYAGHPSYSLLESSIIALLLGVSLGKDIGTALQEGVTISYYYLGLAIGLSAVLTYWVWGPVSLVLGILVLTTTIVAILNYTEDLEDLEFKNTINSIPGISTISKKIDRNPEFTTFSAIIIGFILIRGFVSLEDLEVLINYFSSLTAD